MGGAQRFLYELITHLETGKYDITVAAGGNGELFEKLSIERIRVIKIKYFSNTISIKNFFLFFEIFGIIKNDKPDIVYLLSSEAGFWGSLAAFVYRFGRGKPKIIYRIGGWAFKEPRNIFIKKIYLWAEKISAIFKDIIITNSKFDRNLGIKHKITNPEKIITIYNGLDFHKLKFLPKEMARKFLYRNANPSSFVLIGTIANLYKNKGLGYLIRAAKIIKENGRNWHFTIIGEGPERQNLEKLIKKYELGNTVHLTGHINDAYKCLKAFDLFALSSSKEGQPWAILEAMAAARPIVATNIAGIPEMIENEKSGLLVEPADFNALAAAIEKILIHPSLAHECAENALKIVKEKFGIEKMIQKNEELF